MNQNPKELQEMQTNLQDQIASGKSPAEILNGATQSPQLSRPTVNSQDLESLKRSPLVQWSLNRVFHRHQLSQQLIDPSAEIHPTALLAADVEIGAGVKIGPYCIIGQPAEWKGLEHKSCGVKIGAGTVLTGFVTIDAGVMHPTEIGEYCYLMKGAHVGHDAQIGNNVVISCGAKIGGCVLIHDNCNIGLNAVIHQTQMIAPGCMIGMGSVVTKKLQTVAGRKYAGNPAGDIGANVKK